MSTQFEIKAIIVISGSTVSSAHLAARNAILMGVHVPTITSCQMFIQASFDTTSANFHRIISPVGSGDYTVEIGAGQRCVSIGDVAHPFPYIKFELDVAQGDDRTLNVTTKL